MTNNMIRCPCGCEEYIDREVVAAHLNDKLDL